VTNELYMWDCGQFGIILVKCLTSDVLIPNSQTTNVERHLRPFVIILKHGRKLNYSRNFKNSRKTSLKRGL